MVDVSDGYAKNFVIKNNIGLAESDPQAKKLLKELKEAGEKEGREKERMKKLADQLGKKALTIKHTTGKDGKIFGSIKEKEISQALASQFGITLDKHSIEVPAAIRTVGAYTAHIDLGHGIKTTITINAQI